MRKVFALFGKPTPERRLPPLWGGLGRGFRSARKIFIIIDK